jgi:hypothetical protein
MVKFVKGALLVGVASLAMTGVAMAQLSPDISAGEFKCQQSNNKAGGKFVAGLSKCATKCQQGFFKGDVVNYPGGTGDCYAPYGGLAATCVDDPILLKGANNKFGAAIKKKCDTATNATNECPTCYDEQGGNAGCGDAGYVAAHVQDIGNQVASFGPGVFCKTTGATSDEQKCQQGTAKTLAKLVGAINKCFDKCFKNASKLLVDQADCQPNPVLPNDAAAQTCIGLAQGKSTLGVDKKCSGAGVTLLCPQFCTSNPDCDSAPLSGDGICTNNNCSAGNTATVAYSNGTQWTNLVTNAISGNVLDSGLGANTGIYCDSQ